MRKISYNEKRRNKCEYCTVYRDGSCKWKKCHYEPERFKVIRTGGQISESGQTAKERHIRTQTVHGIRL